MNYRFADTVFQVDAVSPRIGAFLKGYECGGPAKYRVAAAPEDIDAVRESAGPMHSEAYYEVLALHRLISRLLLAEDVLLMHGSALALDGQGYIFTAPSGTGKSTHARLWRERFGDRVQMINDDKPFLKITEAGVNVYGSPWSGKHRLNTNTSVPLKAIALLERGASNSVEQTEPTAAIAFLLQQSCRVEDMEKIFPLVLRLAEAAPVYRLCCNTDASAADTAYKGMR